ncbi:MAG TPA: phage tail tip lysozyme [Microbacterium sp.]|nr:phage tail tip lysozyme [Microbacterium sp.]
MGVFAAFAAVGFAAAYVGPMGAAFAEPETAAATTSLFAEAIDGAQTIQPADEAAKIVLQRDSYAVYVKPKPTPTARSASTGGGGGGGGGWAPPFVKPDPGSAKAIAYDMVKTRGWSDDEFACLVALWNRESGWRVNAYNKSSGAYGIPQALPGKKMASAGADWQTSATTQIKWGLGYIKGRYGTPCGAWAHSQRTGWY